MQKSTSRTVLSRYRPCNSTAKSSLRQMDLLDVSDEQLTAFVVYRPEEAGVTPWKVLFAKRADSLCIYEGGIATPLNPRLAYTVYHDNGIRLGATDRLPLALAGHQNEYNPGRFNGYIAEVIVLAKPLGPQDEQGEIVDSYLYEKYFRGRQSRPGCGATPATVGRGRVDPCRRSRQDQPNSR